MRYFTLAIVTIALFSLYEENVNALPQRYKVQNLLYRPPPTKAPRPMRARREVKVTGSKQPNLREGGSDLSVGISGSAIINNKQKEPEHVLSGSLNAERNTNIGHPITKTAEIGYSNAKHDFGVSISKSDTPNVGESFKQTAQANLYNDGINRVDASIYKTVNTAPGSATQTINGGTLKLENAGGHSFTLEKSIVPGQSETLTQRAHLNFFDNNIHKIDTSFYDTKIKFSPDLYERSRHSYGTDIGWSHIDGFGANVGLTHEPEGNLFNYDAYANLYKTKDERGSFDIKAGGTKWLDGPYSGKKDFNIGGIYSYNF